MSKFKSWTSKIAILAIGVLIIMSLATITACGVNKYNAEMHYNAQAIMNADYIEANMTLGAYVGMVEDTSSPATRTHIIRDKDSFDLAFSEFPQEVDFSERMVLVYFFTSSYPTSPYKLGKVSLSGSELSIEFKLNKSGSSSSPDAAKPQLTCIVVLIDKLDITVATFNKK